jgi:hypothetical protein
MKLSEVVIELRSDVLEHLQDRFHDGRIQHVIDQSISLTAMVPMSTDRRATDRRSRV